MKDKKEPGLQEFLFSVYLFFVTVLVVLFSTYLIRMSDTETIRNTVITIILTGILLFTIEVSKKNDDFLYQNRNHLFRAAICYTIGLLLCVAGGLVPEMMLPAVSFAVILFLLTNLPVGICIYFIFCTIITLLSAASADIFFYYFLNGFLAIMLFQKRREKFRIFLPVMIITLMSAVSCMALSILKYYELTPEMIINPGVGILLNILILCIALRIISKNIINPYDEKYLEINDPEYNLLAQLKEFDKAAYYLAIHTAYLGDRIADRLSLNRKLAKGGGYYHKIGLLRSKNYMSKNTEIGLEYGFPPELIELMNETCGKDVYPTKKETTIVLMADAVVTSITFLIKKDSNMPIEYDQVIDVVFKKKLEAGILQKSEMQFKEYYAMKQYFKEEKLYYDFLR